MSKKKKSNEPKQQELTPEQRAAYRKHRRAQRLSMGNWALGIVIGVFGIFIIRTGLNWMRGEYEEKPQAAPTETSAPNDTSEKSPDGKPSDSNTISDNLKLSITNLLEDKEVLSDLKFGRVPDGYTYKGSYDNKDILYVSIKNEKIPDPSGKDSIGNKIRLWFVQDNVELTNDGETQVTADLFAKKNGYQIYISHGLKNDWHDSFVKNKLPEIIDAAILNPNNK